MDECVCRFLLSLLAEYYEETEERGSPLYTGIETALYFTQHRLIRRLRKTRRGVNVLPARRRRERRRLP